MQVTNLVFVSAIVVYWIIFRTPAIIKGRLTKEKIEKEKLKVIGELPLILSVIFYIVTIYFIMLMQMDIWIFAIGFILLIFGAFYNEWARFTLGKQWSGAARILKKHKLITSGPYSAVRHPMYFANILMYLGCLIVTESYILLVLFLVIVAVLAYRIKTEEYELSLKFGMKYKQYVKKVALIVPYIF